MASKHMSSSLGYVQGPYVQESLVCQYVHMTNSQGVTWFGGDLFAFTFPVALLQFIAIFFVSNTIWFLLKPLKQGLISAQIIAGIILGQSFLGKIKAYNDKLFPPGGILVLETFAEVGFMLHLFLLGVHVDVSLVKRVRRNIVTIGTTCYLLPLILGLVVIFILNLLFDIEDSVKRSLPIVVSLNASSSFPVITALLADLNILNSEIGKVATLASLISDMCNYTLSYIVGSLLLWLTTMNKDSILTILSTIIFVVTIVFVLRPLIVLMGKRVPEGQQMKESQFIVVVVIVLICGFSSEFFGQPAGMGTFILGMVIPDGPPLGSCLVNKLSAFVTGLLVPVKFMLSGLNMDLFSIGKGSGVIIGFVIFVSYTIKFFGTLAPALYYKIPLKDAVTLALIMCCRGIIEIGLYITLHADGIINSEAYALLLISMLIVTGIARLLISHLYDPSSRYLSQHKNTILSNNPNDELRILFCVHKTENVPTIINLLEASNPTRDKPIVVFILNLMELKGRAASVLESNTRRSKLTSSRSWSKQVANAFDLFAQKNHNSVLVRHFTSIAPYASMHDDICTLGLDQNANIMIVPFHKQWSIDGTVGSKSPSIRMVNQNVIKKSPCSVGVLVDRGQVGGRNSTMFQICVVFLGGADDCEALAYITRFIDNPQVNLKLVWIRPFNHRKYDEDKETEDSLDAELVDHFRASITGNERVSYKEELVKDAIGTTRVIRSLDDGNCDLCVVGRYHEPDSPVLFGMNEWNECPELGLIGDMLATSDFKFSVLVVQQQAPGNDLVDGQPLQTIASSASYSDYDDYQLHQSHSFHSSYSNYSDRM